MSSIVVFLVALPLCMGIAIASGAPVATGLITGIIGGLLVGCISGSPLQVSGPAAGLTVVVYGIVSEYGLPGLGMAVLVAGLFQMLAGWLRLGQWFRAVSPSVVHGMLSGIGVLIFVSQLHVMVDDKPRENGVQNILSIPAAIEKGLPLPQWTSAAERQEQSDFLKAFGLLHLRQNELQIAVADRVSQHGSESEHARQAHELQGFVARQEALFKDLQAQSDALRAASFTQGERPQAQQIRTALDSALTHTQAALVDLQSHRVEAVEESLSSATNALAAVLAESKNHDWAAKVGLLTILAIVLWQLFAPKKLKVIPAPLLAVVLATLIAAALSLPVLYVEVPARLTDGITLPSLTTLYDISPWTLLQLGLMIAVIASAESLLSAAAVDKMHSGPRSRSDQELFAQGVGNFLCGILGALPMTGVIVRSAANVQAGAKTRLSTILHASWLLLFVVFCGFLLRMIPTACLAGILVYTGYKLIGPRTFLELWKQSKTEALIYATTLTVVVVEDLLIGVVTGLVLSALKLLWMFSHLESSLHIEPGRQRATMALCGAATFLRLPILARMLEQVPRGSELRVDIERLTYIDHACLDLLREWEKQHAVSGGRLSLDWGGLHMLQRIPNGNNNGRSPVSPNGRKLSAVDPTPLHEPHPSA